jgi:hypothetical protein
MPTMGVVSRCAASTATHAPSKVSAFAKGLPRGAASGAMREVPRQRQH